MTEDEKDLSRPPRTTRRRAAPSRAPSPPPTAEVFLEPSRRPGSLEWAPADDASTGLDLDSLRRAVERIGDDRIREVRSGEEWADPEGRIRVILGDGRLLVRLALLDETRDQLARRLDDLFDLSFDLGAALGLEVRDPQFETSLTRFRYESQFQRILDTYHRRARTAAALEDSSVWKILSAPAGSPARFTQGELPALETDLDALPSTAFTRKGRKLGTLELIGDRALSAIESLRPEHPFLALLPLNPQAGDQAPILRVLRYCRPTPGTILVEALSEDVCPLASLRRTAGGIRALVVCST